MLLSGCCIIFHISHYITEISRVILLSRVLQTFKTLALIVLKNELLTVHEDRDFLVSRG